MAEKSIAGLNRIPLLGPHSTPEELLFVNREIMGLFAQVELTGIYAEAIVDTVREPLLVLDGQLRVKTANQSYYKAFRVNASETGF